MQKLSVKAQHQEPASAPNETPQPKADHVARMAELGAKKAETLCFLKKTQDQRTDLLIEGDSDAKIEVLDQAIRRAKQKIEGFDLQMGELQKQISVAGRAKKATTFAALWPGYAEKLTKLVSDVKSIHVAREELQTMQNQMASTLGFAALDCCAGLHPDTPINAQTIGDFERQAQIALATGDGRIGAEWPE